MQYYSLKDCLCFKCFLIKTKSLNMYVINKLVCKNMSNIVFICPFLAPIMQLQAHVFSFTIKIEKLVYS